ncbi:hypothetical protein NDQ72_10895 [Halomonas sp. KG2]|uniref:hypothetical protein n=1 Tax=Halomonas sp. KG2 TaxID=2951138 RepID=UPI00264753F8|nr:hypothetical protein [Halomonas sp. KG2]WKD26581.1 hypothetical protein NDQ72_10895 [Halomonas sp. KG2]
MSTPPFDPASEPLGSSHPLIRDINTKNLDIAVNTKELSKWINRFGEESPTLWLLTQLQEAANAIVGGGEDITQAWLSAISNEVLDRIADNPLAYTSTLANGDSSQRPPLTYSGSFEFLRSNAVTGSAYSIQAPNILAIRKLTSVRSSLAFEIRVLSGVSSGELNDDFFIGIAWFDKDKLRLSETPSTEYYRGPLSADSQRFRFTVQNEVGDIEFPSGAVYMLPYIGTDSTTGRFWGSELTITDITESIAIRESAGAEYKGYVGNNPANYVFDVHAAFPRSASSVQAQSGSLGQRLSIIAATSRSCLGLANLIPVSKRGEFLYDINYSASILQFEPPADGNIEVAVAWFDQDRNYISEAVGLSFAVSGTLQAMADNVVRSHRFDMPAGATYARPFLRLTGTTGIIAVLKLFATPHISSEYHGPSIGSLPAKLLRNAANVNVYDPVDDNSVHLSGNNTVESINDSISARPLEALGGIFSKPVRSVIKGYPCITSIGVDENVRMTVGGGVTYGPGTMVFATYADSAFSTLRSLVHGGLGEDDPESGSRLRINANAIRDSNGNWLSRPGRLGIAIDGVVDGASGTGDPLAANAPQDAWGVFSLVLKEAPEKSEFWCNGLLVDTFTMPSGLTRSRRTDLFKGASFDAGGVAFGRMCFTDHIVSDDERMQLEKWAAEPIRKPLVVHRKLEKPVLQATSVCAMRVKDRAILFEQNPYARQNIASMTKVFTALIADQWVLDFNAELAAPIDVEGAGLQVGDVMSVQDAVSLMLIPSNNACSTAVGRRVGQIIQETEGVQDGESADFRGYREMERIGRDLGMVRPQFDGFIAGTLEGTQVCSLDVCRAMCLVNSSQRLMSIMRQSRHTATIVDGPEPRTIDYVTSIEFNSFNANRLHNVLAAKTGTTGITGQSLTLLAEMPGGDIVAFTIVGSTTDPDRYEQLKLVMDYVEQTYY